MINTILQGDVMESLKKIRKGSVHTVVTSPPYYGLRDYGVKGQIGIEETPEEFIQKIVEVFREVRRVLRDDGTVWLNLGDTYASGQSSGNKKFRNEEFNKNRPSREFTMTPQRKHVKGLTRKDMIGIPWKVAFALQADGWVLRQDIIWHKPNPMPESVKDRCTKAHEYIFLLTKNRFYYFDHNAIKEPAQIRNLNDARPFGWAKEGTHHAASHNVEGKHMKSMPKGSFNGKTGDRAFRKTGDTRSKRSVWTVSPKPYREAHFATFPPDLIEPCILAGAPKGGIVLDPFIGSGTTAVVARQNGRRFIGCELNPKYVKLAINRLEKIS